MFKNENWSKIGDLQRATQGISAVFFNDQIFVAGSEFRYALLKM